MPQITDRTDHNTIADYLTDANAYVNLSRGTDIPNLFDETQTLIIQKDPLGAQYVHLKLHEGVVSNSTNNGWFSHAVLVGKAMLNDMFKSVTRVTYWENSNGHITLIEFKVEAISLQVRREDFIQTF